MYNTIKKKQMYKTRKASALSVVMILVVILSILSFGIMQISLHARMAALRTTKEISARSAADAGVSQALGLLNKKIESEFIWDHSSLPSANNVSLPNCNADYSFTIEGDPSSGYTVKSIGRISEKEKTIYAGLRLKSLFEYAIFANEGISLKMGTTIDGINYDPDDPILQLGTNSIDEAAMSMKNGVTVIGDVIIGPEGDIDYVIDSRHEALITGDTFAQPSSFDLPTVTVPSYLTVLASQGTISGGEVITTNGKYDSIQMLGINDIVVIDGDVTLYIIGEVVIGNSCELQIVGPATNPDASLTLFVGGDIVQKTGGLFNNLTADATTLKIYGLETCLNIDFLSDSVFYGAIYAPYADMVLHNSVEIYGAVVVNSFLQQVEADFFYDAALQDVNINDVGATLAVSRWYEQ